MKKLLLLFVTVLMTLAGLVINVQPAQGHHTPGTGPVYDWRWAYQALSNMCLDNHSSFPAQTATGEWNKATELVLRYEGCGSYPSWARIDLYNGINSAKPGCWYSEASFDAYNRVSVMRIFLNTTKPECWSTTIRTNHWVSQAIGGALGLRGINTYPPDYVSVMRTGSQDTVSWPQTWDRRTFNEHNDCGCHA